MSTLARKTARKGFGFRTGLSAKTSDYPLKARIASCPERGAPLNNWTATGPAGNLADWLAGSWSAVRDVERRTKRERPATQRLHGLEA